MSKSVDKLKGGRADNKSDKDFDPKQLRVGAKHEKEHTSDAATAKEIARDHLAEDPKYYIKLKKIEKSQPAKSLAACSTTKPEETNMNKSVLAEIMARDVSEDLVKAELDAPAFGEEDEGRRALGNGNSSAGATTGAAALGFRAANLGGVIEIDLEAPGTELENPGTPFGKSDPFGERARAAYVAQLRGGGRGDSVVRYVEAPEEYLTKSEVYGEPIIKRDSPMLKSHCCGLCKSQVPNFLTACPNCGDGSSLGKSSSSRVVQFTADGVIVDE